MKSSYRSIFKATSLFGGVQIYKILIELLKQKAIALFLGPEGMGIRGLYGSSISLIQSVSSLGLSSSAVRDIAEANTSGDLNRIAKVISVLKKLIWITGITGMLITIFASPMLSKNAFGNYDYVISFIILSSTLLLQQLSLGQTVVLQGLRKFKPLAKCSIFGALLGLIVSVPIYYIYGIKGVVIALVLDSVFTLILSWYYSKRVCIKPVNVSVKESIKEGKGMLSMGIVMTIDSILVMLMAYILRTYISGLGGVAAVGLYTAGFAIVNQYAGMVFNAMSTDYYPRLAGINTDNIKCHIAVNQQAELATLIISPLVMIFMVISPLIIILLYTSQFLSVVPFMKACMLGMLFKGGSWSLSYLFLAKKDMKTFLMFEVAIVVFNLSIFIPSYKFGGLNLLGLSYLLSHIMYYIILLIFSKIKYNISFTRSYTKILIVVLLLNVFAYLTAAFCTGVICVLLLTIQSFILLSYVFKELDKRIKIIDFIKSMK